MPEGGSFNVGIPKTVLYEREENQREFVNLLAMDGGGIRGLIPAQVTDYLEKALYKEAVRVEKITSASSDRSIEEERLPLSKFF